MSTYAELRPIHHLLFYPQHSRVLAPMPTQTEDLTSADEIWQVCEEITRKKNWYTKIFQDNIIAKWRAELPPKAAGIFDVTLGMLRATAQGSNHVELCDWENNKGICSTHKEKLKQLIIANPSQFDVSSDDIEEGLFEYEDWDADFEDWGQVNCNHPRCKCIAPNSELKDYVQYHPTGLLDDTLHAECKTIIAEMAAQEPIDWHPGSNEKVRDIVHPSLYCYVKGVSLHQDGKALPECEENVRYQWLPSQFKVAENGKVTVASYINNLKAEKYPRFIPLIERVFECFLPSLEHVLHKSLKNRDLQVIVKVGSINLTSEKPSYPGGSWHIEGMPYEHIAATGIHYVDINGITDSFLEFRKPTILNEENLDYPQSDSEFTTHHYGIEPESHHDGIMNRYLGLIRCHEGASIVFPNTLQHKVKDFALAPKVTSSTRIILAFFVIHPEHPIVSTTDVPPQQNIFSVEQAHQYRERLMIHRKFFVNKLNETVFERPFSLCEH